MTEKQFNILTNPIVWNYLISRETYDILEGGEIFKLPILIGELRLEYVLHWYRIDGCGSSNIKAIEKANNRSVFLEKTDSWSHVEIDFERDMLCVKHNEVLKNLERLMLT